MLLLWLLVIVCVVLVLQQRDRLRQLDATMTELRAAMERMSRRMNELSGDAARAPSRGYAESARAREAARAGAAPGTVPPAPSAKASPYAPLSPYAPPAAEQPATPASTDEPEEAASELSPALLSAMADATTAEMPASGEVVSVTDEEVAGGTSGTTQTPPPSFTPPPPPSGAPPSGRGPTPQPDRTVDWEGLIGVRLFSWIAGVALFVAAIFFLSYSAEQGWLQWWLQPAVRMAIGIIVGVTLLGICELPAARRYSWTANALDAAGVSILFGTFYYASAHHLIPDAAGFGLLVIITAVTVLLAVRRESLFIALLGLVGGFATPALLSTGQDNPVGLFGYLLLLNAGLAWVAYKKGWPLLTALSLGFTTLYQWGWVTKFLTSSKLPLAVAIFLIFPILSFVAFAVARPRRDENETPAPGGLTPLFGHAARLSAALPLLFSIYLAAVPAYGERYGILFGFLLCIAIGLFAVALFQGPQVMHLLGALSTLVVFAIWFKGSYDPAAWPGVLGFVVAFVAFYLLAPRIADLAIVRRRTGGTSLGELAQRAVLAAPLLLFVFPVLAAIEPRAASPALLFGVLLALLAACAWHAVVRSDGSVHFVAAFFALAAEAVWSARHLTPERLLPALAIYGIFGLFYIGVPVAARRRGHALAPQGAAGALTLVSIALLFFLAGSSVAQSALWGIAILVAILNVGLFAEASASRLPLLALAGGILSWIVLAVWWATATVAVALVPALAVVGGFALLTMAGHVWANRRAANTEAAGEFQRGIFLGLAGHLFLAFVATQPQLAVPPWPLLAVLGVLTLAAGVGSLYLRHGALMVGAVVAGAAVIVLWQLTAEGSPWPNVAVWSAGALVVVAGLWTRLARRTGTALPWFDLAAALAGLLAQIVTYFAGTQVGEPGVAFLLAAHLVFLAATLLFVTIDLARLEWLSVAAVVPAAAAGFLWRSNHPQVALWSTHLAFAAPLYLAFIAYPLVLGGRAAAARAPYAAAVLASAAFFFQARASLLAAGFGAFIGALPVAQAAFLALVLLQLVRLERARGPGRQRTPQELARLALIAGASLGFITVAIPLQLEKNWITIGWALEGAALAWLYTRVPHKGLLAFGGALFVAVFVRLALNPEVLTYEPRGALRIWNWYLYTYLLCAAAFLVAGRVLAKADDRILPTMPRLSSLLPAAATILLFLLLNIEIADFYATGPTITFNFTATLAQDLTYTLGWALFAVALLGAGIAANSRPARIAAIALIAVATVKCALHDLWRLGGLYRVGSLVGLAVCLLLITVALQKFVLHTRPEPREALS